MRYIPPYKESNGLNALSYSEIIKKSYFCKSLSTKLIEIEFEKPKSMLKHFSGCFLTKSAFVYPILCLSFLCFATSNSNAQGNLLISPKRIVFDGTKKTQEINLANTGKDTAKYLISVMEIRMTEYGGFEELTVPDSGQFFASKYLRFFPRSVTLAPNESQVVKVQLIKTNELTESEYRSHVYFRANLDTKPMGEQEEKKDTGSINVQLIPVFGITIPIIIRNGAPNTQVKLGDCVVKYTPENTPVITMAIYRAGNMSSYGDINVEMVNKDGKKIMVGMAKGVAVYTPNKLRRFQFELNLTPGINLHNAKLHITYTAPSDQLARGATTPEIYAETDIVAP
jgi:hypothetical protein